MVAPCGVEPIAGLIAGGCSVAGLAGEVDELLQEAAGAVEVGVARRWRLLRLA
jgi:hypothetical protein